MVAKLLRGEYLERKEAIAVLKELLNLNLIEPSLVALNKIQGGFNLMFKADCNLPELKEFMVTKNLMINEEKGFCVVSKL